MWKHVYLFFFLNALQIATLEIHNEPHQCVYRFMAVYTAVTMTACFSEGYELFWSMCCVCVRNVLKGYKSWFSSVHLTSAREWVWDIGSIVKSQIENSYSFRNFTQNAPSNKIDGSRLFKSSYEKMNLLNSEKCTVWNCLILSLTLDALQADRVLWNRRRWQRQQHGSD